jgi:iron-sulfur cluster assembly protein
MMTTVSALQTDKTDTDRSSLSSGTLSTALSVSERAADHIKRYLAKRGKGLGLRLGVKKTGCSGLAYVLEYVDEIQVDDERFESHGVSLFVAQKNLIYLKGLEVDFVREGLQEGFKFNNPNESARCGCGESFTVDASKANS